MQATRATVVLLLLISAGLVLIVTAGGWSVLQGAWFIQVGYILVYLLLAFFAARWSRGVLPVAAALAVILLVFALVAGPFWFARDKSGFSQPAIDAGLLGHRHAADRARPDAPDRLRHARLLPGLERRARAPRADVRRARLSGRARPTRPEPLSGPRLVVHSGACGLFGL